MSKINIFIDKAKKIHGDRYDYSLVDYLTASKCVKIKCKEHGIFEQTPNSHLSGCGCKICFNERRLLTFEHFLNICLLVHGDRYDYSKVFFKTTKSNAIFICKIHGDFSQRVSSHLSGIGCKKCSDENQSSTKEDFINKANKIHNHKYDYSCVVYKNNSTKIKIICPMHGDFMQPSRDHLSGKGCSNCKAEKIGNCNRMPIADFISQASVVHHNFYDYSRVVYKNNSTKIKIICPEHGDFEQNPNHHLNGSDCPLCSHKNISKMETEWLDSKNIAKENRNVLIIIDGKKYKPDAYDSATNTIYEFYGDFWHGNPKIYNQNKINKANKKSFGELYNKTMERENKLLYAGYNVISIWEHDWIKGK